MDLSKISSISKIKLINYSSYYKWIFVVLLLLAFNGFNFLATENIRFISKPTKDVMELVNALMRGENRLLEAYAQAYEAEYSKKETVPDLIPHMLEAFIKADRGFRASTIMGKLSERTQRS